MKDFWEERYAAADYVYGKKPNVFFADQISNVKPGKILLPCEGEGRNAVYAAKAGWEVDAVDLSENAREKAMKYAGEKGVKFKYYLADATGYTAPTEFYDAIGLIYSHFHNHHRKTVHNNMLKMLRPGGLVIMEAFSKKQLSYPSCGPKDGEMLYALEDIKNDFIGLKKLILQEVQVELSEGSFHTGKAMVVRMVAKKII